MDIEAIDSVVEQHMAADVDALVDGDAPWQVEDSDYPPVPMSAEDWSRDCADYVIGDTEKLRNLLYLAIDYGSEYNRAQLGGFIVNTFLDSGLSANHLRTQS